MKKKLGIALCFLLLISPVYADPLLNQTSWLTLQQQKVTLNAFHGKVVIVNFWATWCAPCRQEMPLLNRMRNRLVPKGVEVVGIALDEAAIIKPFLRTVPIDYPIWLGNEGTLKLMRGLGNQTGALPYTLILNIEGKVVATYLGLLNLPELEKRVLALTKRR